MGVSSSADELDASSEGELGGTVEELDGTAEELDGTAEELDAPELDNTADELDAFELDDTADELDAFEEELVDGLDDESATVPFTEGGMYFEAPWL